MQPSLKCNQQGRLHDELSYLAFSIIEEGACKERDVPWSFYKPFLDILPHTDALVHIPNFWDPVDLLELEGSPLLELLERRKKFITEDFDLLCRTSPRLEPRNIADFFRAYSTVTSRTFSFNGGIHGGKYKVSMMVPYVDMLNDSQDFNLEWDWDSDTDMFTVTALHDIPSHSPMSICYGHMPNYARLINYGYVMDNNILDHSQCSAGESSHQLLFDIAFSESRVTNYDGVTSAGESTADQRILLEENRLRFWNLVGDGTDRLSCLLGLGTSFTAVSALSLLRVAVASADDIRILCSRLSPKPKLGRFSLRKVLLGSSDDIARRQSVLILYLEIDAKLMRVLCETDLSRS